MGLTSVDKTIQGDVYTVTQFKASKAVRVLVELGRLAGPSLALLVGDEKSGEGDALAAAVGVLVERMDGNNVEALINDLAASTMVQVGAQGPLIKLPTVYELHFAGSGLTKLFEWLRFALEVHFSDFLDYLVASGQDVLKGVAQPDQKAE